MNVTTIQLLTSINQYYIPLLLTINIYIYVYIYIHIYTSHSTSPIKPYMINYPYGNGLCHLSILVLGMVDYCFNFFNHSIPLLTIISQYETNRCVILLTILLTSIIYHSYIPLLLTINIYIYIY